jgi:hypothetical protein
MKKDLIKQLETELEKFTPDFSVEKRILEAKIPDYLLDLSEDYNIVIAGGAITSIFSNQPINDWDLYFTGDNNKDYLNFIVELLSQAIIVSVTDRSMMLKHKEHLINVIYFKPFDSIESIFNSFDFTCVMGAYSLKDEEFILHKDFLKSIAKREIVFNPGTDFPIVSLLRSNKYQDKGYSINKNTLVSIVLRCMELNIDSYEELESHIGGAYGLDISKLIDTKQEFSLSNAINQLLSARFNIDSEHVLRIRESEGDKKKKLFDTIFKDVKLELFSYKGHVFQLSSNKRLLAVDSDLIGSKHKDLPELPDGIVRLYKFVKRGENEGEYVSFWTKDFVYRIGEEALDAKNGLWGGCLNQYKDFPNSNDANRVLIEIEVDTKHIKSYTKGTGKFNFSRCRVVGELKGKYGKSSDDESSFDITDLPI